MVTERYRCDAACVLQPYVSQRVVDTVKALLLQIFAALYQQQTVMSGRQIWYKDKVTEWSLGRNISTPEILSQNKVHVIKADGRFAIKTHVSHCRINMLI